MSIFLPVFAHFQDFHLTSRGVRLLSAHFSTIHLQSTLCYWYCNISATFFQKVILQYSHFHLTIKLQVIWQSVLRAKIIKITHFKKRKICCLVGHRNHIWKVFRLILRMGCKCNFHRCGNSGPKPINKYDFWLV